MKHYRLMDIMMKLMNIKLQEKRERETETETERKRERQRERERDERNERKLFPSYSYPVFGTKYFYTTKIGKTTSRKHLR